MCFVKEVELNFFLKKKKKKFIKKFIETVYWGDQNIIYVCWLKVVPSVLSALLHYPCYCFNDEELQLRILVFWCGVVADLGGYFQQGRAVW